MSFEYNPLIEMEAVSRLTILGVQATQNYFMYYIKCIRCS